jgi:signal transduction histidine kinase/ActR/RegA family two-component response regulator
MDEPQRDRPPVPPIAREPAISPEPGDAQTRLVQALAAAGARMEGADDLHGAAAPFLSALREHYGCRRVVLTVTDLNDRDSQWFFAGLSDADIDWFHAHRPSVGERDACLSERYRVGGSYCVPPAACVGRAGLRPQPARAGNADEPQDLLFVPMRGAGGVLLGTLLVEDGRESRTRDPGALAALELYATQMARLLERKRLVLSARNAETRLRQAQEQLMQNDKLSAIGQLISEVAHELNNPLSGVLGFTQLLQASETNPKAKGNLDRIYGEAIRCQKIVQNLLSFGRRHKPEKTASVLNDVIEGVLDLRAYQLSVDDVTIERRYDAGLPRTMLDVHQMQQVVLNLVNNAHQAMMGVTDRPRVLTVTTEVRGDCLRASIGDTGSGIPKDRLARMFDPFFTTKEPGKGTGLGLGVSLGIVKNHEGTLSVESEVGHGTTFTFEIPLVACPSAADTKQPNPAAAVAQATDRALRILVVDDEPVLTELLTDLLKGVGHAVDQARDGRTALAMALERPWDVILTDLKMPALDGQGLYELVCRAHPEMARRFIFSTGDLVNPETVAFLRTTGCAYLSKPFKLESVLDLVSRAAQPRAA